MSEVKVNKISPRTNCGTVTLGDSGDTIALGAGATQTGFGRTGTVDWQTGSIKTTTFTAVNGQGFFIDTNSGSVTANLPAGSAGAIVSFQDYRNTFDTAGFVITPNGSEKINGGSGSVTLTTEGEGITLVYVDGTVGWRSIQDNVFSDLGSNFINATGGTETTSGNCKIHTFTGPGTFTVNASAVCAANNVVSYVVVAGGGGGAAGSCSEGSGGGGAGGYREAKSPATPYTASPLDGYPSAPNRITVTATAFPITVGGGGAGGVGPSVPNECGSQGASSIFSTITSAGGGGGGRGDANPNPISGGNGGSGGGGGTYSGAAGTGNTPSVTPAQGFNGGVGGPGAPGYSGGAGGGATAVGGAGGSGGAGCGGAGATSSINGTPTARSGGGGGGTHPAGNPGAGGAGGGGAGGDGAAGVNGTDNTGGGGGGAGGPSTNAGGTGGSGVVIIRYKFQ